MAFSISFSIPRASKTDSRSAWRWMRWARAGTSASAYSSARRYSSSPSIRISSMSAAKRSRTTRKTRSPSSWSAERGGAWANRAWTCCQSRTRNWMSALNSASPRPSPTVRTMNPPPPGGRRPRTSWRRRSRSSASWIRRETPEVVHLGHVDEVAARQADEGRDPGPLGAERFLGHLDQDLLALVEDVLDRRDHAPLALGRRLRAAPRSPRRARRPRRSSSRSSASSSASIIRSYSPRLAMKSPA